MEKTSSSKYQQGDVVKKDNKEVEVLEVKMKGGKYVYRLEGEKDDVPEPMLKAAGSRELRIASKVAKSVMGFAPNFSTAEEFTEYLRFTLIPDLRRSGSTETAADFAQMVRVIDTKRSPGSFPAYLKRLSHDLRVSGLTATADDVDEAIYWMTGGL